MADAINGLNGLLSRGPMNQIPPFPGTVEAPAPGALSFQDILLKSLDQVNQLDQQAQSAIEVGLTNGDLTQAEVLTAMKKADLAYRTMLQIRNKIVDSYKEIQQLKM